jgi:hypothetical protein
MHRLYKSASYFYTLSGAYALPPYELHRERAVLIIKIDAVCLLKEAISENPELNIYKGREV